MELSSLELMSLYISAACHDVGHFGRNNSLLNNSMHDWAIIYNDKSPLENFHACYSLTTILKKDKFFLSNLSNE